MQQVIMFIKILPSLYRMEGEAVYAYLPEESKNADMQMNAEDIFQDGGTFVYLRYSIEEHKELLATFVGKLQTRPTLLFLENDGDYTGHWKMWELYLQGNRMRQTGILFLYGFRLLFAGGCGVEVNREGIRFMDVYFGKKEPEACLEMNFSWDGRFRFLVHAGEFFLRDAQIRYELDGYDDFTQRYLFVVCRTETPRWDITKTEDGVLWAKADIFWDIGKETAFTFPTDTVIDLLGFPMVRMETLAFRFAAGTEEYYLAPYGKGVFLEDADVKMGDKGICRIRGGDRMQLSVMPEGYLGKQGLCAEVSMLNIYTPLFAAGVELEITTSVPVLPAKDVMGERAVERFLSEKLQRGSRLAYRKDICMSGDKFELCVCGREILWFNLFGKERNVPEIALCHVRLELAQAMTADAFFAVLDGRDTELFDVPYTIDKEHIISAAKAGYPEEECRRLMDYYSKGRIFLGESSFRQAVENADCAYAEAIRRTCHHFQVCDGEEHFSFLPEDWTDKETVFVIKKGTESSVTELTCDVDTWSFRPGQTGIAQKLLKKVSDKAQGAAWEDAFLNPGWEGSIVINRNREPDGTIRLLILQAGESTVICGAI